MELKSLFGLPAHPLLVHIPIVLIPLAAIGALGLWWKPWRDRLGWATAAILVVAGIFTQLAIGSGQALEDSSERDALVRAHTKIAEDIRPWLLLFFVALVAFLWLDRRRRAATTDASTTGRGLRDPLLIGLFVATVAFAGVSVYWVQRIGHSGAKAVWHDKGREGGRAGESGEAPGG
jgi:uncharacterized membrane protein